MSTHNPPNEANKYLVFGQRPTAWTKHLERRIPSIARQDGRHYFNSRSIDIRDGSREHVEAWAPDLKEKAVVKIDVIDDTICASCTCGVVLRTKEPCSHIWGVILTSERKGYLGRIGE